MDLVSAIAGVAQAGIKLTGTIYSSEKAEAMREQKRERLLKDRRTRRRWKAAMTRVQNLRRSLDLSAERARKILEDRGQDVKRKWKREYLRKLDRIPNRSSFAEQVAEEARRVYLEAAQRRDIESTVRAGLPWALGLVSVAGAGIVAGQMSDEDEGQSFTGERMRLARAE
mgnify:CR=1 FL=1